MREVHILKSGPPTPAIASAQPTATVASSTAYSTVIVPRTSAQRPTGIRDEGYFLPRTDGIGQTRHSCLKRNEKEPRFKSEVRRKSWNLAGQLNGGAPSPEVRARGRQTQIANYLPINSFA